MSFRRLFATTCVVALCASPALPQTAPPPPSVPSFVAALPELSMRDALRSWGLSRPSRSFQFVKSEASATRAAFSALVSLGADGKRTTLDNLVITRSDAAGPTMGQYSISADNFVGDDGTKFGRITVTGLRGTANILETIKAATKSVDRSSSRSANKAGTPTAYAQSISIKDMTGTNTSPEGTTSFTIQNTELSGMSFGAEILSLDRVTINGLGMDSKEMSATVAAMDYSGIDPILLSQLNSSDPTELASIDLATATLGHFSMNGLNFRFKSVDNKPSDVAAASIGRISIDNVKDGFIGQFAIKDAKTSGGVGAKAWEFGLARFNLGGVNMAYYTEAFKGMSEAFKTTIAAPAPATTAAPVTVPVTSPSLTAPVPQGPPIMLKTMLKGGPLDGGLREIDFGGLKFSMAGYDFTIDQIGMTQVRNNDGIVTRANFAPTKMRFSWPRAAASAASNPFSGMLASLGSNNIEMGFSAAATFAPATDRLAYEDYVIDLVGWGKFKMDFALTGMDRMMGQTSVSDFVKATSMVSMVPPPAPAPTASSTPPASPSSASASGPKAAPAVPAKRPDPLEPMRKVIAVFGDLTFDSGRLIIEDTGGIEKAARLFSQMGRPANAAARPVVTAQQIRQLRDTWSEPLRQMSGDKTKPVLMRQFSSSMARWLDGGGSMMITSAPATPIRVARLADTAAIPPATWGLSFTNQPAAAAAGR